MEVQNNLFLKTKQNKRWTIAMSRPEKYVKMMNESTEAAYHRIITFIKQQHLKPTERYFERDYKHDTSEGIFGMHCFMTPSFYWALNCSLLYTYEVEFAFSSCPCESDIRHMIRAYPLDRNTSEAQLQPDFKAYYDKVLQVQEPRFIHSLQGN
ncbi:hypothetical protein [Mucilaginibacter boryungensis]|uniref:Uncharacterized protein n=1 Tax=Mucilaginibacter boryungensis TaxID=768480 RepID=A0ABR9XMY6_9SPHI|nr:hypothetical protein [Mucilaginibacter boryungensis]MBE9668718.1 hypothetical protein [Mucilaginibacter boryungensis]